MITPNLVSTIIPVHNRLHMLKAAVESVLQQSYRPVEVLIVDDGSTDETGSYAANLAVQCPGVVRTFSQPNRGPGPARELGRVHAKGEYIQYLDSDDRLLPGKFAEQVAVLRANPDCGIAYGITRLVEVGTSLVIEPFKWTGRDLRTLFPGLLVDRWWCTHTPLYRRSVCDQIGPWSDLRYSQDWEYDARAGGLGVKLASTGTLVSEHYAHGEARQTGGKWLSPTDQVRFFNSLYESSRRAGTELSAPEMQHFARWVFAQARACGALGESEPAKTLFRLAVEASAHPDWRMRLVGLAANVVGWRVAGRISQCAERSRGGAGPRTQKFSWQNSAEYKREVSSE